MLWAFILTIFSAQANFFNSEQLLFDMTQPMRNYIRNLKLQAATEVSDHYIDYLGPNNWQTGRHIRTEVISDNQNLRYYMTRNGNEVLTIFYQSDEVNIEDNKDKLLNFDFHMPLNYKNLIIDFVQMGVKITCQKSHRLEQCTYNIGDNNYQVYYLKEKTITFEKTMLWYTCSDCDGQPAIIDRELATGNTRYFLDKGAIEVTPADFSRVIQFYIGPLKSSISNKFNLVLKNNGMPIF